MAVVTTNRNFFNCPLLGGAVGHTFEMGLPKDYPCEVWFNLVQRFQRKRFKCDLLSKYQILTAAT
jgi:hypothetical protein